MPTVSVIIVTWNARQMLARCLGSLQAQTLCADQIVVVDNHSSDDTLAFLQAQYPQVTLVALPQNRGVAGGLNAGIEAARGDYIALLNNDAFPTPTWLEALLHALQERPEFSIAACRLLKMDGSQRIDSAGDGFDLLMGGVMLGHDHDDGELFDHFREVFSATAGASLYRRQVLARTGGFDESLFMYGEDIDLGFRARLLGYRCLYVPHAIAYHAGGASIGAGSPEQIRLVYRNGLTVYFKNVPWELARPLWARLLRTWLGALRHAPHRAAALHGALEALLRLPATLRKRTAIQRTRKIHPEQLLPVMGFGIKIS